jgi:acetolactate decarboxylase
VDFGHVDQANSAGNLFAGHFEGVTTVEQEFGSSRLGIGVMHDLDGEVISVHGTTWAVPPDGTPRVVDADDTVAFGIAAHGGIRHALSLPEGSTLDDITTAIDAFIATQHASPADTVCALEITGSFRDVLLRTVHHPDYEGESLGEIIDDEIRFSFPAWQGTLVGFRYPDDTDGSTIPGLHLHGIDEARSSGGHVRNATVVSVTTHIWLDELGMTADSSTDTTDTAIDFSKYEGPVN